MSDLASAYNIFLIVMTAIAVVVFIALFFIDAGYGMFKTKKWGPAIPNRLAWVLMESPVFILMIVLFLLSDRTANIACLAMLIIFEIHYFQRSFIFPFLIKGKSTMPLSIMAMGITFNSCNALMQGGWLFYVSPAELYTIDWLTTPQFIIGTIVYFIGMSINIHSDHVIRTLRKPGDTKHYFPNKGMYRYVTSGNYFGECVEWLGFACLTWSWAGLVFFIWSFANLAPRAKRLNAKYQSEFPEEFAQTNPKALIPFIF